MRQADGQSKRQPEQASTDQVKGPSDAERQLRGEQSQSEKRPQKDSKPADQKAAFSRLVAQRAQDIKRSIKEQTGKEPSVEAVGKRARDAAQAQSKRSAPAVQPQRRQQPAKGRDQGMDR